MAVSLMLQHAPLASGPSSLESKEHDRASILSSKDSETSASRQYRLAPLKGPKTDDEDAQQTHVHSQHDASEPGAIPEDTNTSADTEIRPWTTRPLHRYSSYGDGQGFVCMPRDKDEPNSETDQQENRAFECHWDGDEDPLNPFNTAKIHKWTIVALVSLSSLCV